MKKMILVTAALLLSALSMEGKVILYYGTSHIQPGTNIVTCKPTAKLCAVVIILGPETPSGNWLTVYGDDGSVVAETAFRAIRETSSAQGTTLTWLP